MRWMASLVPRFTIQSIGGLSGLSRSVTIAASCSAIVQPTRPEIMHAACGRSMDAIAGLAKKVIESPTTAARTFVRSPMQQGDTDHTGSSRTAGWA